MDIEIDKRTSNFKDRALEGFKKLLKSLKSSASSIKQEFPKERQLRELKKIVAEMPEVKAYLVKYVGPLTEDSFRSKRNKTLKTLSQCLLGEISNSTAMSTIEDLAIKCCRDLSLYKKQKKYLQTIPKELRAYLPDTLIIDVDSNNRIKYVGEAFANKTYTVAEKALSQKKLLNEYSDIGERLKSSLSSNEECEKISSLVSLVILETGIRPGRHGNTVEIDGEQVETFGATTLKREHITFKSDGTAVLRFIGKKGAVNRAVVQDPQTVKHLKEYADRFKTHDSDYLFVFEDGSEYQYRQLKAFFNKSFPEVKITDLRKLRATEEVYEYIREERDDLMRKIKSYVDLETEEAEQKVIQDIAKLFEDAHNKAQIALSHESSKTTKQSYINPDVILHFLSTSNLKGDLRDCILKGNTTLRFDPMMFIRESQKVSFQRHPASRLGLNRALEILELI